MCSCLFVARSRLFARPQENSAAVDAALLHCSDSTRSLRGSSATLDCLHPRSGARRKLLPRRKQTRPTSTRTTVLCHYFAPGLQTEERLDMHVYINTSGCAMRFAGELSTKNTLGYMPLRITITLCHLLFLAFQQKTAWMYVCRDITPSGSRVALSSRLP